MVGEELGLVNYWGSIWKKRWLVIAVTVIAPIVATLIYPPGRPAVESFIQADVPAELEIDIKQIVDTINQSSANGSLPAVLNLQLPRFPAVWAEAGPDASQIRVVVQDGDIQTAKTILQTIVAHFNKRIRQRWTEKYPERALRDSVELLSTARISRSRFISEELTIGLAIGLGFFGAALLACVLEYRKDKKRRPAA